MPLRDHCRRGNEIRMPFARAKIRNHAKEHMVAKYDLNNNGLSKDEITKMSLTGKRAVDLAKALKAAAVGAD